MEMLLGASRGVGVEAILLVEHDMDIVFGYSDRIVVLHQGRVLADTTPAALRADDALMAAVAGRAPASPDPGGAPGAAARPGGG
jgi:branched-chain amino acid transport system ATP-binding protein